MTRRSGGFRGAKPTWTTTSTSGIFGMEDVVDLKAAGQWPRGPVAPTSLAGTAGDGQVALTWVAPATTHGAITDYVVEYTPAAGSPTVVATGSTAAAYTLTGLTNDTEYTIRVAGVNHTRGDWSSSVAVTPSAVVSDPDFANVSLLLHMDGSNGSTTFTDSSNSGHSFTANGNARISTAESKFGGASAYFDGTGDYLSLAYNADFDYGQGPFTIEMWFNAAGFGIQTLYAKSSGTSGVIRESSLVIVDSNRIEFYHGVRGSSFVGRVFTLPFTLSANTWYHLAFSRDSSNNMRLFVNGVASSNVFNDNTSISGNLPVYIGVFLAGSIFNPFTGYIDDFRITKGVARYTANFTPPTAPFPDA